VKFLIGLILGGLAAWGYFATVGQKHVTVTDTVTVTETNWVTETETRYFNEVKWVTQTNIAWETNTVWKTNIVKKIVKVAPVSYVSPRLKKKPKPVAVEKPKISGLRGPRPTNSKKTSGRYRLHKKMDGSVVTNYY